MQGDNKLNIILMPLGEEITDSTHVTSAGPGKVSQGVSPVIAVFVDGLNGAIDQSLNDLLPIAGPHVFVTLYLFAYVTVPQDMDAGAAKRGVLTFSALTGISDPTQLIALIYQLIKLHCPFPRTLRYDGNCRRIRIHCLCAIPVEQTPSRGIYVLVSSLVFGCYKGFFISGLLKQPQARMAASSLARSAKDSVIP